MDMVKLKSQLLFLLWFGFEIDRHGSGSAMIPKFQNRLEP